MVGQFLLHFPLIVMFDKIKPEFEFIAAGTTLPGRGLKPAGSGLCCKRIYGNLSYIQSMCHSAM
jgi:hypothetical protein